MNNLHNEITKLENRLAKRAHLIGPRFRAALEKRLESLYAMFNARLNARKG
jgi:peptidoglycan hydrolase CwlO-like protein